MTRSSPVRVGLIGLGNSGWFYHAQAHLTGSEQYELVAVCARDAARAGEAARQFGARAYTRWQEMVGAADVELVVIALPHHLHFPVTMAAIAAGKHVLVEKPMALTGADAQEMIVAAATAGVQLSVYQQRRWEPDFQVLRELIDSGEVGRVWHAEVARSHAGRYRVAAADGPHRGEAVLEWPHQADSGGGISWLVGPHPVDQLVHLIDSDPVTVAGQVHRHEQDEVEHYIAVDMRFADGASGRVSVFRQSGIAPPRFAVYGSKATVLATDGTELRMQPLTGAGRSITGLRRPSLEGQQVYDGLYRAIQYGEPPPVTAEEGRLAVHLLELAHRSAAAGGQPLPVANAGR